MGISFLTFAAKICKIWYLNWEKIDGNSFEIQFFFKLKIEPLKWWYRKKEYAMCIFEGVHCSNGIFVRILWHWIELLNGMFASESSWQMKWYVIVLRIFFCSVQADFHWKWFCRIDKILLHKKMCCFLCCITFFPFVFTFFFD